MIRLQIEGMKDFLTFIMVIRNQELDVVKIQELVDALNKSTDVLVEAETTQTK